MNQEQQPEPSWDVHRVLALSLQLLIVGGLALEIIEGHWLNVASVTGILVLTVLPSLLARGVNVFLLPEFELLTIGFIFAALFLGETRDYYARFWWWDNMLHLTSAGLLGILGVLLIYILNADPRIDRHMQPGFVALFAFSFAVMVGAVWEIFEFAMDRLVGTTMQKPMADDPSGLTDTMADLIVDVLGALAISLFGYTIMKRRTDSFVESWIQRFVARNPKLFSRRKHKAQSDRT